MKELPKDVSDPEEIKVRFQQYKPDVIARKLGAHIAGTTDLHSLPKWKRKWVGRQVSKLIAQEDYMSLIKTSLILENTSTVDSE